MLLVCPTLLATFRERVGIDFPVFPRALRGEKVLRNCPKSKRRDQVAPTEVQKLEARQLEAVSLLDHPGSCQLSFHCNPLLHA
jgi:hypothetical protein